MKFVKSLLICGALGLSGCATMATSPVSIAVAAPVASIPASAPIRVVAEPGEVDWSAEQALRSTGQQISETSPWRLRVSDRTSVRQLPNMNFECRYHQAWPVYGRHYRGFGHGFYNPWCDQRDTIVARRTITWILEDNQGRVWWQASAREPQMDAPPSRSSMYLAEALASWRGFGVSSP